MSPGYWIWSICSFENNMEEYSPKPTAVSRLPISKLKHFDFTSFRTHSIEEYPPPKEGIKKKNITNVYFIQSVIGGPVKIGKSNNVEQRLEELQTGSPYILQIIKIIKNVKPQVEREFHEKFKDYRSHGEWFDEKVLNLLG